MDVKNSEDYFFKKLEPELYSDLVYISKSAFNIDPGVQYYEKKNQTQFCGHKNLGFIAYHISGEPAAFYGVYAHPMIIDGNSLVAAQSGDTMTHKNHVGKGLFIKLAKMTYQLAQEKGIEFIFGFPNNNSYPGFVKKLEWQCPYMLKEFRFKVSTLPLSKLAKKISFLKPFYDLYLKLILRVFSKDGNNFQSSVLESGVGGVYRTDEFYKYKSFNGAFLRTISNCSVWMKVDGFLFIGDLERDDKFDYNKIIKKVKKICFWAGIDTIIFQCSPETFLETKLSSFSHGTDAFYMGYLKLNSNFDPSNFKYVFADVDTF